jgi:hypothetical protein
MYFLHQNIVNPARIDDYESAARDFVALANRHPELRHINHVALRGDDFVYTYAFAIESMADVDAMVHEFGELARLEPELAQVNARSDAASLYHIGGWIVTEVARIAEKHGSRRRFDIHYLRLGHNVEALAAAKAIDGAVAVYTTITGAEMPSLIVERADDDAPLDATLQSFSRRSETKRATLREELTIRR